MNNAELIKALKDAEMYLIYVAPNCYASCEAIKAIRDAADALEAAEKRIAELEAQLPKEGEWVATRVEVDGSRFTGERCSRCGWWKSMGIYKYCPNCGARMKGEQNGNKSNH